MARYLIVANQTIGGEQLTAKLDELVSAGSSALRFLVPVTDSEGTQQWDYPPIDRHIPDAHRIAKLLAEGRLEYELARLRRSGVQASGEVVDAQPVGLDLHAHGAHPRDLRDGAQRHATKAGPGSAFCD